MKKILYLTLILLVSTKAGAFDRANCPTTDCPTGAFMGDDGKCYNCDEEKRIEIYCIGKELAEKICPNRIITDCLGLYSNKCPKDSEKLDDNCCINKKKDIVDCFGHCLS